MSTVHVHATGEVKVTTSQVEADYYQGEANTVGGLTIDGVDYPAKIDESDFDPIDHTVVEVQQHLAQSTAREQARVLDLEASSPNPRVTLVGEVVESADPTSGAPLVTYDVPDVAADSVPDVAADVASAHAADDDADSAEPSA